MMPWLVQVRTIVALLLVALATFYTPVRAWCADHEPGLASLSLVVGLVFAYTAAGGGRFCFLLRGASDEETLTAVHRAKRILWIWAGFGGAVLVLSFSVSEKSPMDEAFGMVGFGWLVTGIAALLLESVAFSLEDAHKKPTSRS